MCQSSINFLRNDWYMYKYMHYTERFVKTQNNTNFYYKVIDWISCDIMEKTLKELFEEQLKL